MASTQFKRLIVILSVCALCAVAAYGQWTPFVNVSNTPNMFSGSVSYDFDANGNIHLLFYDFLDANRGIYYANNVGGAWSKTVFVWGARYPVLIITPDQVIHAFYQYNGSVYEVTKPVSGGSWSAPFHISADTNSKGFPNDVVMDASGGIYIGWYDLFDSGMDPVRSGAYGRYRPLGGSWGPTELIVGTSDKDKWPMDMYLSANGMTIYCCYNFDLGPAPTNLQYRVRQNGVWSAEKWLPFQGGGLAFAFSPTGEMAATYARNLDCNPGGLCYNTFATFSWDNGVTWSPEFQVSNCNWLARGPICTLFDATGNFHMAWQQKDSDPDDFDMWYRCRIGGVWQSRLNLTNNSGRTGAPWKAMKARGNDIHYFFTDTTWDSFEDVYYTMKPGINDPTPPGPVTSFAAAPGDNRIQLSWRNPSDSDYMATMVRMSTSGYPAGPWSNTFVCIRTAAPGSNDAYLVYPLTAGTRYYFSAFAQDMAGNWSVVAQATAVPLVDYNPPAVVASFSAVPYTARNLMLTWTNPSDIDFKGTMIRCKTTGYPVSPTDGSLVCNRQTSPGVSDSYLHDEIATGVRYYYSAFAYDVNANYAGGVHADGVPVQPTCGYAKSLPDNSPTELNGEVVTAIFSDEGCIYVQEPDRSGGIRVVHSGAGLAIGDRVTVTGTLTTRKPDGVTASERQISSATVTKTSSGYPPAPVAVTCDSVGGAATAVVPGVKNGVGLNNIGLLVRTAGKVTHKVTSYIYVDDGSNVQDISGRIGVMVRCPGTPSVGLGDIVTVTGVIEGSIPTGWTTNRRYIRMRGWNDLVAVPTGPVGLIGGYVRDTSSNPISGAVVSTSIGGYSTTSGADGSYALANVSVGVYDVTASKTGYQSQTQYGVPVADGQTTPCSFSLTPLPGSISGFVRDTAGSPIAGATVSTNIGGYSTTSSGDGSYTLANVASGTYSVTASKTNYNPQTVNGVVVSPGAPASVSFNLSPQPGTISGYVRDTSSNPISGATVATNTGGYTTTSGGDGSYTLSGVAPGTYNVTASKTSYAPQTQNNVAVQSNQTTAVNFSLTYAPTEKVVNGDCESGFFSTGWNSTCSGYTSKLPGPNAQTWGWNNDSSYPFNTYDSTGTKHAGSHALGFAFCQTAASPGKMGIAFQSVNLGAANATATFSVWAYHTDGNCPSIMCWNPGQNQSNPSAAYSAGRYQWVCTDNWGQRNTWVNRTMTVTADSSGYVTIMVGGAAHTGTSSGADLFIDDVSVI